MIADVLNIYGREIAAHRRSRRNLAYNIQNLLRWWGTKNVREISANTCREYATTKTDSAAGQDLKVLRAAVGHWHKEYGPLDFMPSFWRPEEPPSRERWLTREEAARLVRAAKPYSHLRRMILLGLYTGSRPGVLLAMQWGQIDLAHGLMTRMVGKQPKNKKAPKVRLGRRILAHLRRWKRLDGKDAQFVCAFQDAWHPGARQVKDPHGTWDKVVTAAKLKGVTRHTLRHTRATWMMQKGVPVFEAAGFLGMSVRTLEQVYGHHAPTHQERAANI